MDSLISGFAAILTPSNIMWVALGVTIGYYVGVMPGLGKVTAVAVAIPITFYLAPLTSISFLVGIAKGSGAGSAVSAILLNTPGEPSSAPTALDGYPLARQGKAQKALKMGLFASVIGDTLSTLVLILLAAPLATYALLIGPVELCAILLFSLTFIAGLSGGSMLKGLIAGTFGLLFSCVGMEIETATPRLIFGLLDLYDGLSIVPVGIGMLAIAEMAVQMGNRIELDNEMANFMRKGIPRENKVILWREWKACFPSIIRGTLVGSSIGILPGLGASVGSFLSYGLAKRVSQDPDRFGKGALEGVAAAESADNAVIPASFVPLFALGIPGSVTAALLIGAFLIQGVTPGPLIFVEKPELIAGIYAGMICASLLLLVIGYFGQPLWAKICTYPLSLIIPVVIFFCAMGSYMDGNSTFGIWIMLFFGVFGFFTRKLDFSFVTFLIGFVVGPAFELSLRQAIAIMDRDVTNLIHHPIAMVFIILTVIFIISVGIGRQRREIKPKVVNE